MAFEKGKSGNENGRPKGAQTKTTSEARKLFVQTLEDQVPNIAEAFQQVKEKDPTKYLELLAKYAQYFVPKMVDINIGGNIITVIPPDKRKDE